VFYVQSKFKVQRPVTVTEKTNGFYGFSQVEEKREERFTCVIYNCRGVVYSGGVHGWLVYLILDRTKKKKKKSRKKKLHFSHFFLPNAQL